MAINSRAINSAALNSTLATGDFGTFVGTVVTFEQSVGISFTGTVVTFEQTVDLLSEFSAGTVVTFTQNVVNTFATQTVVTFRQTVIDSSVLSFYDKNNYDVRVIIGDHTLLTTDLGRNANGLCDNLTISGTTTQARNATFSFIPPESAVVLEQFQGERVVIEMRNTGPWEPVFFGYVNLPSLDFISRKITLSCDDNRKTRLNSFDIGATGLGLYSEEVLGTITSLSDKAEKILQTISYDFNYNRYGDPTLTSWDVKATPDHTVVPSDALYIVNPTVEYTNRNQTLNSVTVTVNHTYQRLHHQVMGLSWPGYDNFLQDFWAVGKPSFPQKQAVMSAANNGGWIVPSSLSVNFIDIWPAQSFDLGAGGFIVWEPNKVTNETKGRTAFSGYLKDGLGAFVQVGNPARIVPQYDPVLDSEGNQIQDVVRTTTELTSAFLCRGANWGAVKHFAQTVTESYQVSMTAPQSVSKYGEVPQTKIITITDEFDTDIWDRTSNDFAFNFYLDKKLNPTAFLNAADVAFAQAKHDILLQHRDVHVGWSFVGLKPAVDLCDTIDVTIDQTALGSTASIHAIGTVKTLTHNINFNTLEARTNVSLVLSRASGSAVTEDALVLPPITIDSSYIGTPQALTLGTHLGKNPDPLVNPAAQYYNGWIGNKEIKDNRGVINRTTYQESFIVDYPAIPDELRQAKVYTADSTINIDIPNDLLEVSF